MELVLIQGLQTSTVYKLQKQAAQVILDTDSWERSTKLFKELNWLPLDDDTKIQ